MADAFIIKKHWITEKSVLAAQKQGKYAFEVRPDATKNEVKKAIKELFKVDVVAVNIVRRKAKVGRFRAAFGIKSPSYKKAVVTLKKGQVIDLQ